MRGEERTVDLGGGSNVEFAGRGLWVRLWLRLITDDHRVLRREINARRKPAIRRTADQFEALAAVQIADIGAGIGAGRRSNIDRVPAGQRFDHVAYRPGDLGRNVDLGSVPVGALPVELEPRAFIQRADEG